MTAVTRRASCWIHPDHRLAALKMRRRRQAGQREEEFDALGPEAREFHLKLLAMPIKPTVHLRRLLGLVRLYGRKEVLAAIGQALQYQTYDAAYVETLALARASPPRASLAHALATQTPRTDRRHSPGRARPGPLRPALRQFRQRRGDHDHDIVTPRKTAGRSGGVEAPPHRRNVSGGAQRGGPQAAVPCWTCWPP